MMLVSIFLYGKSFTEVHDTLFPKHHPPEGKKNTLRVLRNEIGEG
jgi:hypothetical protein